MPPKSKRTKTWIAFFLVKEKTSSVTKTGNPYLKLKLGDRSGEMEGRIWSSAETFTESFQRGRFRPDKRKGCLFPGPSAGKHLPHRKG